MYALTHKYFISTWRVSSRKRCVLGLQVAWASHGHRLGAAWHLCVDARRLLTWGLLPAVGCMACSGVHCLQRGAQPAHPGHPCSTQHGTHRALGKPLHLAPCLALTLMPVPNSTDVLEEKKKLPVWWLVPMNNLSTGRCFHTKKGRKAKF